MSKSEDVWSMTNDSKIAAKMFKDLPAFEGFGYQIEEPILAVERLKKMRTRPGITKVGTDRRKYVKK